jgi:hypothetical protein
MGRSNGTPFDRLTGKEAGKTMMATLLLLLAFASIGFVQMPLAMATTPVTSSSSSPSPSSAEMERQEQETTTITVISSATNRSFDRIVSLADEIVALASQPGQSPDQIDETILQIGMRDQGIQMLAEEAALLPHIESTFGQSDAATAESATTTTTITTSNGAANNNNSNTGNAISSIEGSQTNETSETELTVNNNNNTSSLGLSEIANNETSTAAAEGIGLQDINSLFVSISTIAQEIRDMASQQYTTNEEIDNTAHAIIMRSEGIMSLLRDLDTVSQIREVFLATSNRTSSPQQQ